MHPYDNFHVNLYLHVISCPHVSLCARLLWSARVGSVQKLARGSYSRGLSFSARREVCSHLLQLKTRLQQRQSLTWRAARARASICMPITPAFYFVSVYVRETPRVESPVTRVRRSNSFCSADPVQCVLASTEAATARFTQPLDTQPPWC